MPHVLTRAVFVFGKYVLGLLGPCSMLHDGRLGIRDLRPTTFNIINYILFTTLAQTRK